MDLVIAFGGSVLAPATPDPQRYRAIVDLLARVSLERRMVVVVGGGAPARNAIQAAKAFQKETRELDRVGIAATHLNAHGLRAALQGVGVDVAPDVPVDRESAQGLSQRHRVVIMGGTEPGHSTDQVAASMAKLLDWNLVIATNVDGVYDRDPRKYSDAVRHAKLDHTQLLRIVGDLEWKEAGQSGVIDGPATALIVDHQLRVCVLNGEDVDALRACLHGEPFHGTIVERAA